MSGPTIEERVGNLTVEFREYRKGSEEFMREVGADVKTLIADKNERHGADKVKKVFGGIVLGAIPTAVYAAIYHFMAGR
ncbi:MAG: hypothetical protein WBR29_10780 [Gammaproteobacteria bacterium]